MAHTKANAAASTEPRPSRVKGAPVTGSATVSTSGKGDATGPGQPAMSKVPALEGSDNEISSAVPSRILQTHTVRRATHTSSTLKPSSFANAQVHGKPFGAK